MTRTLTWRNNGSWAVIAAGAAVVGMSLVRLLFDVVGAREGAIDIDAMAASTSFSLKGLAVGVGLLLVGIILRLLIRPAQSSV